MINMSRILIEGSILSIIFLVILVVTLFYNPRIWLQDYPKDIQRIAKLSVLSNLYHGQLV